MVATPVAAPAPASATAPLQTLVVQLSVAGERAERRRPGLCLSLALWMHHPLLLAHPGVSPSLFSSSGLNSRMAAALASLLGLAPGQLVAAADAAPAAAAAARRLLGVDSWAPGPPGRALLQDTATGVTLTIATADPAATLAALRGAEGAGTLQVVLSALGLTYVPGSIQVLSGASSPASARSAAPSSQPLVAAPSGAPSVDSSATASLPSGGSGGSSSKGAIIGGVVGGVGGALVAAAIAAALVVRRRRRAAGAAASTASLRATFNPAFAAGSTARLTVHTGGRKDLGEQRDPTGVVVRTATPDTTKARTARESGPF